MFGQHPFSIHAGDFGDGEGSFSSLRDSFTLPIKGIMLGSQRVAASALSSVEIATEESVKRLGGTAGWGLASEALLGPAGMLAWLLLGGRGKKIVFAVRFADGRKFLASSDSQTFTAIQAATFDAAK